MLLPVPGLVSLAREVFPDCLSGASQAAVLVSITLWKLSSRQLQHLSECSTWWLPALCTQSFTASSTSLESFLPLHWGGSHRGRISGDESGLAHSSPCESLWWGQIPVVSFLVFPAWFLCAEWLRLHDKPQSKGQQWRPCLNNPECLTHWVPKLRNRIKFNSSYLGVFPISSEISC